MELRRTRIQLDGPILRHAVRPTVATRDPQADTHGAVGGRRLVAQEQVVADAVVG